MNCGVARGCHLANSMVNPLVNSFGMQIFKDALIKQIPEKKTKNIRPVQQYNLGFGLELTPTLSIRKILPA